MNNQMEEDLKKLSEGIKRYLKYRSQKSYVEGITIKMTPNTAKWLSKLIDSITIDQLKAEEEIVDLELTFSEIDENTWIEYAKKAIADEMADKLLKNGYIKFETKKGHMAVIGNYYTTKLRGTLNVLKCDEEDIL